VALLDPDFSSVQHGWWVWVGVSAAVTLVAFPWVIGALVHDVAEGRGTVAEPYARTWDRLRDLILSAVVTTVGIALGIVAFVVPGLILFARWALVVPLIVLERLPWRAALGRSNQLVQGHTARVLAVFALLTLIALLLVAAPVLVGYFVLEGVVGAWLATLAVDTVFLAFYSFAPFVLYRRLAV
jgi:Membrane domain of glycerophosphoryl diester phosphodiesterase